MTNPQRKLNPRFFEREPGGSVRLRIRLTADDASLVEEAAGSTPLVRWIHNAITQAAHRDVTAAREAWPDEPPADAVNER